MREQISEAREHEQPASGNWSEPDADTIRWEGVYRRLPTCWESVARYCPQTDRYIGREPRLFVNGRLASFEEAVVLGKLLGQNHRWMRPE